MASAKKKVPDSLIGLNAALLPEVDDPLGTNRMQRGVEADMEARRHSNPNYMSGPLPDRQWDGFFQSLTDNGVTRVAQDAARPEGIADDPALRPGGVLGGPYDATPVSAQSLTAQDLENQRLMRSNNIATPASLTGLRKALRR